MTRDGSANWRKFKQNLDSKIERRWRRLRNIASNHKIIGRVSRKKCKIFQKPISKIQELLKVMLIPYIVALLFKSPCITKSIMISITKLKSLPLIKICKEATDKDKWTCQNLKLMLRFGFISKNQKIFKNKSSFSSFKRLYRKCRKFSKREWIQWKRNKLKLHSQPRQKLWIKGIHQQWESITT